ncbi:hypothetical protein PQ462_15365 [Flavobacterium sp. KACC 22758]|uniref:hypothetical protein n=1 Tax=Flavobacterium sp. KACC 22758 TaxID=3025667 RepID=UPI002366C21F|nr:hypothetical protein [Flavobacterium sp. KACC 22758]WDF58095.1 hypothetical protein PQ462_15365 [Flavobacterium sp. KACC 22758]
MKPINILFSLLGALLGSVAFVTLLLFSSESAMQKENPFTRRFIPMSAEFSAEYKLDGYGYYFAGSYRDKIYLGNHSTPLYITEIDTLLRKSAKHKITLDKYDYPFQSTEVRIDYPYFFLYDGMVPVIFRGNVSDFSAKTIMDKKIFFTDAAVINGNTFVIRGQKPPRGEHLAGLLEIGNEGKTKFFPDFLIKQQDGVFDTDGQFTYDKASGKVIYIYYYRNEFIAANSTMQLSLRGRTIDTVSKAKLEIVTMKGSGDTRLAAPPLMVNRQIGAEGGVLFVQSMLMGKHESIKVWNTAGAIDLYYLENGHYLSSFYVYHSDKNKLKEFTVTQTAFYGILGDKIQKYSFGKPVKKHIRR